MKVILFWLLAAALARGRCSPDRLLCMKNNTADTVQITWVASEDSIGFNPFVLNNSKELNLPCRPAPATKSKCRSAPVIVHLPTYAA